MRPYCLVAVLAAVSAAQPGPRPFERVQLLEPNGETSAGAYAGDLDGDGVPDLVLGKGRHWPLHNVVLLNNGKGAFTASNLGAAPDRTYATALADLDLDGDLDIAVSNDDPDRKLIYRNDGKGRFTESGAFGDPSWTTRYVTLADLDGDRYPDIIVANRGGSRGRPSFVCRNDGRGAFPKCDAIRSESATSIVAADFDGDGQTDLFVPHRDGGQSRVLWNDGQARFTESTAVGAAAAHVRIGAAADFDGDGRIDIAMIDERVKAAFTVRNLDKRAFGEQRPLGGAGRTPYALATADLNNDRRPDIVVGWVHAPGSIFSNEGSVEGAVAFREERWNDGKGSVYGMAFADFDGDGWIDIAAARSDAPNGIWYGAPPAAR